MNPTEEEAFRNIAADNMALGFIVEILLAKYLKSFPPRERSVLVESIKQTGRETNHLRGVTEGDEAMSELLADVVVRMHGALDGYVARAFARIGAG